MGNGSLCKLEIIDDVHIEAPIIDGMYRVAGKFGGLAVYITTAKFKSANILAIAILGSTAKFNSRQYFRLYSIWVRVL